MGGRKLTQKQESFCIACVELGNSSKAYRKVYNADNMKMETVNRAAKELMDNPKIAARIKELRQPIVERARSTVEDLLDELEESRKEAIKVGTLGPAVAATMGKAKLLGLDKQVIDHVSSDGSMSPKGKSLSDFYADDVPVKS